MDLKEIYASRAPEYERLVSREDFAGNILKAVQEIRVLAGLDVVELGAGTGRLTCLLAPFVRSASGVTATKIKPVLAFVLCRTSAVFTPACASAPSACSAHGSVPTAEMMAVGRPSCASTQAVLAAVPPSCQDEPGACASLPGGGYAATGSVMSMLMSPSRTARGGAGCVADRVVEFIAGSCPAIVRGSSGGFVVCQVCAMLPTPNLCGEEYSTQLCGCGFGTCSVM